ncbi:MAG: LysR family transcriptional regulator [Bacteroidales bacterium]|nr:LysR family transcriptional regulator [Bacteroidales bacterium]
MTDFRLEVFRAVAASGSFTLAARELGISQPAVSQHIRELEQETGGALFLRTKGAASLTEKGRLLLDYAGKILHLYERMRACVVDGKPDTEAQAEIRRTDDGLLIRITGLYPEKTIVP